MALPPGPSQPALVQMLQFSVRPLAFFDACARRYGDPFTVRFPALGDFVMVAAPELIKQVFTADPEVLHAGKGNLVLEPVVGPRSVLLLDGKEHLRRRRLLLPPLHGERMQAYAQLIADAANATIDALPMGERFALHPHMQRITLEVILRAVFGLAEGAQMSHLASLIADFLEAPPAAMVFMPPRWLDFPFSPYRAFIRRRDAVDRALRAIIRARAAAPDPARTDILSLLLTARNEDGQAMTEDELRDELITMLLAGHETTATALSWVFACILDAPEVAERLGAELEGARTPGAPIDFAALMRLDYLDAVVKETLRLRPILPDVVRRVEAPFRLGDRDIPVGAHVAPCIHLAHRRAASYPDPTAFRPERFLGVKIDPYAWLPFGGGIRRCLGMAFALSEMKIVIALMMLRTRLALASRKPIRVVRRGVTLAPSGGTRVKLLERRARDRDQRVA